MTQTLIPKTQTSGSHRPSTDMIITPEKLEKRNGNSNIIPTLENIIGLTPRGKKGFVFALNKPYETRDFLDFLKCQYELQKKKPTVYTRANEKDKVEYTVTHDTQSLFKVSGPLQGTTANEFYVEFLDPLLMNNSFPHYIIHRTINTTPLLQ